MLLGLLTIYVPVKKEETLGDMARGKVTKASLKGSLPIGSENGLFFFKILFIHETHKEIGRDTGRGRSRIRVGSLMQDFILGLQDHDLS